MSNWLDGTEMSNVWGTFKSKLAASLTSLSNRIESNAYRLGDIKYTVGTKPSGNWLLCDGRLFDETKYAALYNLLKDKCVQSKTLKDFGLDNYEYAGMCYNSDNNIFLIAATEKSTKESKIIQYNPSSLDNMWTVSDSHISGIESVSYAGNGKYYVKSSALNTSIYIVKDFLNDFTSVEPSGFENSGYFVDNETLYQLQAPRNDSEADLTLYWWTNDLTTKNSYVIDTMAGASKYFRGQYITLCNGKLCVVASVDDYYKAYKSNKVYIHNSGSMTAGWNSYNVGTAQLASTSSQGNQLY